MTAHVVVNSNLWVETPEGYTIRGRGKTLLPKKEFENLSPESCLLLTQGRGYYNTGTTLVFDEGTTGKVICSHFEERNQTPNIFAAAALEKGQTLAIRVKDGRRMDEIYLYTWNGVRVEQSHTSHRMWLQKNRVGETAQ